MKFYLIRHTAVDVPQGVCYGQTDVPLKASFEQEAKAVAKQLSLIKFDAVFTSPLTRCVKLTHYCGFADAVIDDRLQELNFGDWEMQPWDAIQDPHLDTWYKDYITVRTTGGESFNDLHRRFCDFIDDLPCGLEQVAIFTHGGVINSARVYSKATTLQTMFDETPRYGSVTELTINE